MKLVQINQDNQYQIGIVLNESLILLNDVIPDAPATIQDLILLEDSDEIIKKIEASIEGRDFGNLAKLDEFNIIEPILNPEKILCIGLNYADHATESGEEAPKNLVVFSKFNNALTGPNKTVKKPAGTEQFDYEVELVVVIGKEASQVSEKDALDYVAGYTVGNDLSARDQQFLTSQWLLGKTSDGFAPTGPALVTAKDIDPSQLDISLLVNGEEKQASNTSNMIFSIPKIISYLSEKMTLKPGDLIFTGTPEGVALGYDEGEQPWLQPGDQVDAIIEKIGTLTTYIS